MSRTPTGEGLSDTPLLERLRLARREIERLKQFTKSRDSPDTEVVRNKILERYGLLELTLEEQQEIDRNDNLERQKFRFKKSK